MSNIFDYEFDELPLHVTKDGIPAALTNGCAEIKYDRNGCWEIDSVCIEGYQNLTPEQHAAGKRPWIYVPAPTELEMLIEDRLNGDWFDKVQDALNEHLIEAREAAREAYYERERV